MEHTQLLRVKKLTEAGIIKTAARHNLREIQAEMGADSHIDPSKSHLNAVLRGAGHASDVAKLAVTLMEDANVKLRKNAVLGIEVLFSLPNNHTIQERDFFEDATAWASEFFEVPILSAVIHNDEAAPHCHVIMLPLFDGRMIGHGLVGNRVRLQAMHADFHAKVGQRHGLKRGVPARRFSRAAINKAADDVVKALQKTRDTLDEPVIRDALRDAIAETMPIRLMELLGIDPPEVKAPKPKTFAGIMTKKCRPEKRYSDSKQSNAIANKAEIIGQKTQTLSCVAFSNSATFVQSEDTPIQGEFTREYENDQAASCWDAERGEFISKPASTKPASR